MSAMDETLLISAVEKHAEAFDVKLDDSFIQHIMAGLKSLGVLNPKIPDAFCQASLKTLSPKVPAYDKLPGLSAFSVPVRQKYDWAGGSAKYMRAFRFLVTPFEHAGRWWCAAELDLMYPLIEILGEDWRYCYVAISEHLSRSIQSPILEKAEKQIFWPLDAKEDKYLIMSPMADMLPIELAARIKERKELEIPQRFHLTYFSCSSEKFQNSGVAACNLAGQFPKLMSLPPPSFREPTPLPEAEAGGFLAIEFDVVDMNATGGSIMAGVSNITAAMGFKDLLRRQLQKSGHDIGMKGIAVGFSSVNFHGKQENGSWVCYSKKGSRVVKDETRIQIASEMTANARVHLVIQLDDSHAPDFLDAVRKTLPSMRFAGGTIWQQQATLSNDAATIFKSWGNEVWFVADRQDEIEAENGRLDAALDRLYVTRNQLGEWKAAAPLYTLATTGYQAIEPPRPRAGLRDPNCRHVFASNIVSLAQWVAASVAAVDQVFWTGTWNRATYSALCFGTSANEEIGVK